MSHVEKRRKGRKVGGRPERETRIRVVGQGRRSQQEGCPHTDWKWKMKGKSIVDFVGCPTGKEWQTIPIGRPRKGV